MPRMTTGSPLPATYQTAGPVRYVTRDYANFWVLEYWGPRAKVSKSLYFRDADARSAYLPGLVDQVIRDEARRDQCRAERKERDREALERQLAGHSVGQILVSIWGYDQTNVDYYEIVERRGHLAKVRPIARRVVMPGSYMSETVAPVPGHFVGPATTHRITASGIRIDDSLARPCEPTAQHYRSWDH